MIRRLAIAAAVAATLVAGLTAADTRTVGPAVPAALAKIVDPVIASIWSGFDARAAQGHVEFVSRFWRLAGNPGYDAALDRVHDRLTTKTTSGVFFQEGPAKTTPEVFFEQYPGNGHAWDHSVGTLAIVQTGKPDQVVLSRARERLALCINSFSTVPGGVVAPIVDVGSGAEDADYANKAIKGAVVLGNADAGQLWRRGVMARGAIGVISTAMAAYISPDLPGAKATPRETWDILQWSSVPYDEATKGFGFKATPRAAATLRKALAAGPVQVRVTITSTFSAKPTRTIVAEIPGRVAPNERVVMAVHVQEPGAGDNASGVATLTEMARALAAGIRAGRIPAPDRTLTFLWLDEISGSRQWLRDHPDDAKNVKYMFSMDMVGEDVKKSGGSFLIERWPDPGAVWDRPWDPHTEWGRGNVRAEQLKGDLLNDLHLALCLRVAQKSGWVVKTNPHEGGSDHTVFAGAGVPSVLDWHFTDRYYHTNMDTADKTSAAEMRNVAVAVAATASILASSKESTAMAVADLVAKAGLARVRLEEREGARLAAAAPDRVTASRQQDLIVQAWKKWYDEAVHSVARLVVGPPSPKFGPRLDELAASIRH